MFIKHTKKRNNMKALQEKYNKLANKIISFEDKFSEIQPVIKTLDIWIKENDYELIPIMKILNNKIKDLSKIINK